MAKPQSKRTAIPKSIRFEVFKRDSFKCQYCGATAPEVLLVIDHIKPVAKGGDNDITNLVTACAPCNSGKRDALLDERTAVAKARAQMEELQERREQLEMMMLWRQGLRDLADETVEKLCTYWTQLTPGLAVNDHGKANIKKWLRTFSVEEITTSMDIAADQYLKRDKKGNCTKDSWELAFSKIPGICRVERASKDQPSLKDLYYIRGIVRNRVQYYYDDAKALQLLKEAVAAGVAIPVLRDIASSASNWTQFRNGLYEAMDSVE